MARTQESGAYLGGIGVMLDLSDVCPACGQTHDRRKFGLKHRALRECPRVVMGSFPLVSLPTPPEEPPVKVPTASRTRQSELSVSFDPLPAESLAVPRPSSDHTRSRSLGVPWLPPPDLGEVY
jgi:hypothetical protein